MELVTLGSHGKCWPVIFVTFYLDFIDKNKNAVQEIKNNLITLLLLF
jgi:uncharacterized membrane protein